MISLHRRGWGTGPNQPLGDHPAAGYQQNEAMKVSFQKWDGPALRYGGTGTSAGPSAAQAETGSFNNEPLPVRRGFSLSDGSFQRAPYVAARHETMPVRSAYRAANDSRHLWRREDSPWLSTPS